jgi:radical SAM protein with 4Fe4S-binding SPASM domain
MKSQAPEALSRMMKRRIACSHFWHYNFNYFQGAWVMKDARNPSLRGMTLTVTERCNLRCGYCYVPVERGRTMAPETVDAAVNLFARHAADAKEASISFFGGEPFLRMDLMQRAIQLARESFKDSRKVRVATPTNGTLMEGPRLEFCREQGIELAISLDGVTPGGDRRLPDGGDVAERIMSLLPGILAPQAGLRVTARMTVTPSNVDRLASSVAALTALGFRRIFFLPAYESAWDEASVETWGREHRRIATWLVGIHGAGRRPPDLPTWRGVESRLAQGKTRRACGAGDAFVAVGTDGAVFPCYRFLFAVENDAWLLGHVLEGFTNRVALDAFKNIDPSKSRPEEGDCDSCPASDGCTFFCPALGHWLLRDPLAIPAVACRLERSRVEAIRSSAAVERRFRPGRPAARRWATAAALAAAVAGGSILASCSDQTSRKDGDDTIGDVSDQSTDDMRSDAIGEDVPGGDDEQEIPGPGLCPVWLDDEEDAVSDATADADEDEQEVPGPGLCPVPGVC